MKIQHKYSLCLVIILVIVSIFAYYYKYKNPFLPKSVTLHVASVKFISPIYDIYDEQFAEKWESKTGQKVLFEHTYGASGDQMRDVIAGKISPDVLLLTNPHEYDEIVEKTGLVESNWREAFPDQSSPFYSGVAFLVRKGNPKGIKDWGDLTKPGLSLVFSNPKTCGGGRWVYTAALIYATQKYAGDDVKIKDYLTKFLKNVPEFYANQNVSGDAFLKGNKGDVLITYEKLALDETITAKNRAVEIVEPRNSVEISIPISIVSKIAQKNGNTKLARAYLSGLYDPQIQELATKYLLRPRFATAVNESAQLFPKVTLFKREYVFPNRKTEEDHLGEGGFFDSVIQK